ncbi:hypothetical protein D3C87_1751820 [compost metagenome]
MAGDPAGRLAGMTLSQTRVVRQACQIQRPRGGLCGRGVAQVLPCVQHRQTDGPIQQARVQMR